MRNDIEAALQRRLAHLTVHELSAGYGGFLVLRDITLQVASGPDRGARPQRRGQDHAAQGAGGPDPAPRRSEKERGITIDLGFAHARLSDEVVASFIDVPGHEKFVRNMLAGVYGIDAVLLVVAATEGVMPQTREHFHICRLLGIERGIIALTKIDVAEGPMAALAEEDVRDLVRGSFLEDAPIIRVSGRTGEGLDALKAALLGLAGQTRARGQSGLLRLPVDRVFTLRGFGTVVTGTLMGGRVAVGEELLVLPSGKRRGFVVSRCTATRSRQRSRASARP